MSLDKPVKVLPDAGFAQLSILDAYADTNNRNDATSQTQAAEPLPQFMQGSYFVADLDRKGVQGPDRRLIDSLLKRLDVGQDNPGQVWDRLRKQSHVLDSLVLRAQGAPWVIKCEAVEYNPKKNPVEYDPRTSVIAIQVHNQETMRAVLIQRSLRLPTNEEVQQALDAEAKRVPERFAYGLALSTTPDLLDRLYRKPAQPLSQNEFVNVQADKVARAFIAACKVNEELKVGSPVTYGYFAVENGKRVLKAIEINKLLVRKGDAIDEDASAKAIQAALRSVPGFTDEIAKGYAEYRKYFQANKGIVSDPKFKGW